MNRMKILKKLKAQLLQESPLSEFCLFQVLIHWALALLHSPERLPLAWGRTLALARQGGKKLQRPYSRLLVSPDLGQRHKNFLDTLTVQLSVPVM